MLSDISNLLLERGVLSVREMTLALEVESSALHPMLAMLEKKGKIVKLELPCSTSGCGGGCIRSDAMNYYKHKSSDATLSMPTGGSCS